MKPTALTDAEWARVMELEASQRNTAWFTLEERAELDALRAKAKSITVAPELPDDPKTLLTDESRRPQLDGTDWNDMNKAMACNEVLTVLKRGLEVLGEQGLRVLVKQVLP